MGFHDPQPGGHRFCTGWTEAVPLLAREQSLVVAGLEAVGGQLPFPVKGIASDNDSVFINDTLTQYSALQTVTRDTSINLPWPTVPKLVAAVNAIYNSGWTG